MAKKRPKVLGPYPAADEYRYVKGASAWWEWNGEYRKPQKGDWYLSGAIPAAYLSPSNLDQEMFILSPVEMKICPCCGGRGKVIAKEF